MKAKLFSQDGKIKGDIELPAAAFDAPVNEHVIYLVIKALQANQRQGTSKTKGRAEVSGGGRKPWKQKGTGRARAGSNTSPVWRRGGKAHGPDPRDYWTAIPQKLRRVALSSALSSRALDEKVFVVDGLTVEKPKTKTMVSLFKNLSCDGKKNLVLVDGNQTNIYLAGRNIKNCCIKNIAELNAYDVVSHDTVIFGASNLLTSVEK
ncbi:MAG: 50S ribosomal protein L4, partial [Chitinivibrionales bacterium]|nr:50S ribosomal protein L4 [Chitinivibrionales bacterium]